MSYKGKIERSLPWAIIILLTGIIALTQDMFGLIDRFKNSELIVTLTNKRVAPLSGYPVLDVDGQEVYSGGAVLNLGLSRSTGNETLLVRDISVVHEFENTGGEKYKYLIDSELVWGQGVTSPLVYQVVLDGEQQKNAVRVIDTKTRLKSRTNNILDTTPPNQILLSAEDSQNEVKIAILPKQPGLYKIRLKVVYTDGQEDKDIFTPFYYIYKKDDNAPVVTQSNLPPLTHEFYHAIELLESGKTREGNEVLIKLSSKGDIVSQFFLAQNYIHGLGVEADIEKAIELWKKAASHGHPVAWVELGTAILKGDLVPDDGETVLSQYIRAAKLGYVHAMVIAGFKLLESDNENDILKGQLFLLWATKLKHVGTERIQKTASLDKSVLLTGSFLRPDAQKSALQFLSEFPNYAKSISLATVKEIEKLLLSYQASTSPYDTFPERNTDLRFAIHDELVRSILVQGNTEFAGKDGSKSELTLLDVYLRHKLISKGTVADTYMYYKDSLKLESDDSNIQPVSGNVISNLVRPGDRVLLSDGNNPHYTMTYSTDLSHVYFIDPWPDIFLLPTVDYQIVDLDYDGDAFGKKLIKMHKADLREVLLAIITLRCRLAGCGNA